MSAEGSDSNNPTREQRALVERIRAERDRALHEEPDAENPLPPDKPDFPVGVRPDGTVDTDR